MEIIKPSFQILAMTGHPELPYQYQPSPELLIEACGRTCYKSEDKITENSAKAFVEKAWRIKHLTVIEHSWEVRHYPFGNGSSLSHSGNWNKYLYISDFTDDGQEMYISGNIRAFKEAATKNSGLENQDYEILDEYGSRRIAEQVNSVLGEEPFLMSATVRFINDRGVSHEEVRHRPLVISQESTRYVNYAKKGMQFIDPPWLNSPESTRYSRDIWTFQMEDSERRYNNLIKEGWTPQRARSVLPNSLKTELCITAPLSEWQHIFRQRALSMMGKAHEQMEEIMMPCMQDFAKLESQFFSEEVLRGNDESKSHQ